MEVETKAQYTGKRPTNKRLQRSRKDDGEKSRERAQLEKTITRKRRLLEDALRCPPALFQFKKRMDLGLKERISEIIKKYRPETRQEKTERLIKEKEHGRTGPKPVIVKFGLKHITKLVEQKRAKLVLIANNVDPIELALILPALCKKMGVSYAIYDTKETLGSLIGMKPSTCLCLCDDVPGLGEVVKEVDEQFAKSYEADMKVWGGKPSPKGQ